MKKRVILSLVTALILIISATVPAVAETEIPEYKSLLVLGDSISTGYKLSLYNSSNPYKCASYGNLLAADLGLTGGTDYINKAVNGARSADLLASLPSIKDKVAAADLIIISIGGNDLLKNLAPIASVITSSSVSSTTEAMAALYRLDETSAAAYATDTRILKLVSDIITTYSSNLTQIMTKLRTYNPDAKIIFLKQYNPAATIPGIGNLGALIIGQINTALETAAAAGKCDVADVPSVIDANAGTLTNIYSSDIHPNADGHRAIYELLKTLTVQDKTATTEEITTVEATTEPPVTPAPAEVTSAPATTESTEASGDKGCGSFVSASVFIIAALGAAFVFKKH